MKFPPHQISVWKGLLLPGQDSVWPPFLPGETAPLYVSAVLEACLQINAFAIPSFFYLHEKTPQDLVLRASFATDLFVEYGKSLAAAWASAHCVHGRGELFLIDTLHRNGVHLWLNDTVHVEETVLEAALELAHADELMEVFAFAQKKIFGPSIVFDTSPVDPLVTLLQCPLADHLEGIRDSFFVSYRGSLMSQQLVCDLVVRRSSSVVDRVLDRLLLWTRHVQQGAAGGAHFEPCSGEAELLDSRLFEELSEIRLVCTVRVEGVSPLFLRVLLELLSQCSELHQLSFYGDLPLDSTELSVDEQHLLSWCTGPVTLEPWLDLPFPVVEESGAHPGVWIEYASPCIEAVQEELRNRLEDWIFLHAMISSGEHKEVLEVKPTSVWGPTSVVFTWEEGCPFVWQPACTQLLGLLVRFHQEVAPLAKLRVFTKQTDSDR